MSHSDEDEEEVKVGRPRGRPNAYWAEREPDTFGGGYRGTRPAPHGGQQTVKPEDTAGSIDLCWCGLPYDHNWPGKAQGRTHPQQPRKETAVSQPTTAAPHIDRRDLRAYNPDLQELILTAVNKYGVKYRITNNSVILYSPDGESTLSINARSSDRKTKSSRIWFIRHCVPPEEMAKLNKSAQSAPVTADTIKQLAEVVNSEEHLPKLSEPPKPARMLQEQPAAPAPVRQQPKPAKVLQDQIVAATPPPPSQPSATAEASDGDEWVTYISHKGRHNEREHPYYLLNTKDGTVKCTRCEPNVILPNKTSTGGHSRTYHTDTTSLWGPDAKKKATETHYANKDAAKVMEAIELLRTVHGVELPQAEDAEPLKAEVARLKQLNDALQVQVAGLQQEISDQEAKIALAREAMEAFKL